MDVSTELGLRKGILQFAWQVFVIWEKLSSELVLLNFQIVPLLLPAKFYIKF
jgi:hypothetical protein